jgi:hypothetical protein
MKSDIFCWGREVPDEKEVKVLEARRQIGEEMEAVPKIVGIFSSAAGDGRADSGSSVERSAILAAGGSGNGQCPVSEIVVRVRKCAGAVRLWQAGRAAQTREEFGPGCGLRRKLERDSVRDSGYKLIDESWRNEEFTDYLDYAIPFITRWRIN